jgi:hypothetical protein
VDVAAVWPQRLPEGSRYTRPTLITWSQYRNVNWKWPRRDDVNWLHAARLKLSPNEVTGDACGRSVRVAGAGNHRFSARTGLVSTRQCSWEPEAGQHAVVEPGQGADVVAREGEHHQAVGVQHQSVGIFGVEPEGGLAVGPGWYQSVGASLAEGHRRMELCSKFVAAILEWPRRHGHSNIFGEHGNQALHVCGGVRAGECGNKLLFGG